MTRSRPACLGGHPTPPVCPSGGFGTRRRRWRLRAAGALTSGLAAILALAGCGLAEAESDEPERIAATTRAVDSTYDVEGAEAVVATYFGRLHWSAVEALAGAHYVNNANALGVELDRQAAEAAAAAERERQRQAASRPAATRGGSVAASGECSGGPIPHAQMMNESGGDPGAVGPTQPDGSRPVGCWQTLDSHYREDGTCEGMTYSTVEGQRDCANAIYASSGPGAWTAPGG